MYLLVVKTQQSLVHGVLRLGRWHSRTQSADTPINVLKLVSLCFHLFVERFQLGSQIDYFERDFVDPASQQDAVCA